MLQLNNGNGTFSDIGQMAGVASTDWSWSALLADLDLDGFKDIYVTNGLAKDVTSQDYVAFLSNQQATLRQGKKVDYKALINATTSTKLEHYAFRNRGDLTFSIQTDNGGLDEHSLGNGTKSANLDRQEEQD